MIIPFNNPKAIADAGERIYREKVLDSGDPSTSDGSRHPSFESEHSGEYVVINVVAETAHLGATPEEAFNAARKADQNGVFHLIRVGYPGAFQMSYQYGHDTQDWLFG
jgi:uncharacterized GH25 family protein